MTADSGLALAQSHGDLAHRQFSLRQQRQDAQSRLLTGGTQRTDHSVGVT
jgi:hypothetical protein